MSRYQLTANDDRLELLLFYLDGQQRFGINVLKVKEVIACPPLTQVPSAHPAARGVAHLRGEALTVIDLSMAIGRPSIFPNASAARKGQVIITEFNRNMQGFLVRQIDRIVVCDWKNVLPPPRDTGLGSYTTGVTEIERHLVQILDVEKVIGEVMREFNLGSARSIAEDERNQVIAHGKRVLVVDDSTVARNQTVHTLEPLGIHCLLARDGREALELLKDLSRQEGNEVGVDMVISDIEMPEMDGYTLTREIRALPQFSDLYILLHTSLNGAINADKANQAGANSFLTKFVSEELAKAVVDGLKAAAHI